MKKAIWFAIAVMIVVNVILRADDIVNSFGDVIAQTTEGHYDYTHSYDITSPPRYEDRDPNFPLMTFEVEGKKVILDTDPNGILHLEFINCNGIEGAEVVWECLSALLNQINYTAEYMQELADSL